jgi:gamma-glutamyltranspeptidase/glutathione hydrolase
VKTARGVGGAVSAPHHLASEAGLEVLRDGGSAVDAAVTIAATLAVVYPHMNSIGGDSFWLIAIPGAAPIGIDACGRAAAAADLDLYLRSDCLVIPTRGPLAANTVAGTLSGWREALRLGGSRLPLERLLAPAIDHADAGFAVPQSLHDLSRAKLAELASVPGFATVFLDDGSPPRAGERFRQPALARTLRRLAAEGLESGYVGPLARDFAADLAAVGSPLRLGDLERHKPAIVRPLTTKISTGRLYNMPPPTQGLASMLILALFDILPYAVPESFAHIHGLVEATKRAFRLRDQTVGDPAFMTMEAQELLDGAADLARLAAQIDPIRAAPWPEPATPGDTVWFGAVDGNGSVVSAIQSIYFEFGSGLLLPETGVLWQNRGASFTLTPEGPNALRPGRKPFHTLNPALARLRDGRLMAYGTMGGDGQPQTQAAVFTRYAFYGRDLQDSVSAPRWLLGRTWGDASTTLKLEDGFDPGVIDRLREAGHDVELAGPPTALMGHAGAIVLHADGVMEAASDPRSDGAALVLHKRA